MSAAIIDLAKERLKRAGILRQLLCAACNAVTLVSNGNNRAPTCPSCGSHRTTWLPK